MSSTSKLWERYKKSGDPSELIEHYTPFSRQVAKKQHKRLPTFILIDDIEASALVGLWRAIERFDPSKGVPFESYARTKIIGAILDDIREEDHASRGIRDLQKKIRTARDMLTAELGRPPSNEEVANLLEMDVDDLIRSQVQIHKTDTISLDAPTKHLNDYQESSLLDVIETTTNARAIDQDSIIEMALRPLSKKEKLLFALMYFERLTLHQCAPILGLTHPITCQLHFRISERIKECYERAKIENRDKRQPIRPM